MKTWIYHLFTQSQPLPCMGPF
uniref:Uncharacterized protein n=1 Tax=Arundo donax TaxID=35708 RepID=A0A0A9C146_ARUDO